MPESSPTAPSKSTLGNDTTSGGPGAYPSTPPIGVELAVPPGPITPTLDVALVLSDVTNASQLEAQVLGSQSDDEHVLLATEVTSPPSSFSVDYRLVFTLPGGGAPAGEVVDLDWTSGQDHFQVTADVAVAGGTQKVLLFFELPLGQAGLSIANVSAAAGSLDLSVDLEGTAGAGSVLEAVMGGAFSPLAAVPALSLRALTLLAALLVAAGALVFRGSLRSARPG